MAGLGKPGMFKSGSELLPKDTRSLHAHPTRALAATKSILNKQCASPRHCLGDVMGLADLEL